MTRPQPVPWPRDEHDLTALPHGTPLLRDGQLAAGPRDASFLNHPDTHKPKAVHAIVVNRMPQTASGASLDQIGAACNPPGIMITDLVQDARDWPAHVRCRRAACAALFARADDTAPTAPVR